jgi:hypothetical protein
MQSTILARLLISTICLSLSAAGEVVDLCKMKSVEAVVGKRLTLGARMGFTSHGAFLLTDLCSRKVIPAAAVLLPRDPGVPEVDFEADQHALTSLKPYLRLAGGAATACGTIVGEFVSKPKFRTERHGPILQGNGFGPQGALRFAFILRSVIEISSCP